MRIQRVENLFDERVWLDLPKSIYQGDDNYIPHIEKEIAAIFNPKKNQLFSQGNAARWLAWQDDVAIGRIAAFHSVRYASAQEQPTGGIGFFECTRNTEAAHALMQAACAWLLSEGMEAVDGPINFGEKEAYWGLLVENFTDMNSFRMNYNPDYYQGFWESFGFQAYYEQLCYKRSLQFPVQPVYRRKADAVRRNAGFSIRHAVGRSAEEIASDFVTVYNASWAGLSGFKAMEYTQALRAVKSTWPVMDPEIIIFAYHQKKPIGFYINLPEVNEFMQHVDGKLNLWGMLKFLYHKRFSKRNVMVGMVFGVDRAFHGKGVEGAMIIHCNDIVIGKGKYEDTILTWIGDFNPKMVHIAENLGASVYRKLITYRLMLVPHRSFKRHPVLT
ncbi:MAG: hypothetical protein ACKO66_09190 [Flavobacteriales bacterium]